MDSSEIIRRGLKRAARSRWQDPDNFRTYIDLIAERYGREDPLEVVEEFYNFLADADEEGLTQREILRRAFQRFSHEAGNSGGRLD